MFVFKGIWKIPVVVKPVAIIIGLFLLGITLTCSRKPRTDGSQYYKITPGPRE